LFFIIASLLAIYYVLICGKLLSTAIPNLGIGRAMVGELISLTTIAAVAWGLAYLLDFDISSSRISRQ